MDIVGLDLSLTGTGIVSNGGACTIKPKPSEWSCDAERLLLLQSKIWEFTKHADLVVIEGLAFASNTGKATERAGLWWLVATQLFANDVPLAVCPPATLKKYATGKGNADKDTVMLTSAGICPEILIKNNNEADAKILYLMGNDRANQSLVLLPKLQRDALDKVAWPEGL